MSFLFGGSLFVLFYIYLGYPALLALLCLFKGERPIGSDTFRPTVTLIISAYNEAQTIGEKIENSLALHYPSEKLEILVVSDASTDETDRIVSAYAHRGVTLVRMEERRGKTMGLNRAVSIAKGEIVLFSDANAFYEPESLERLVGHFIDPKVGYVTGASRYIQQKRSFVGWCENLYWNYDLEIKRLETALGSMIGADGAMYAIRRELYTPLQAQDINDFLNPLQIIGKGYRGIFEPAAICRESTVTRFGEEYRRKVRIVSRSLRGLAQMSSLLNPMRTGFYAVELISHKLLRWLTPLFLITIAFSNAILWPEGSIYRLMGSLQIILYALALIGFLLSSFGLILRVFYLPYYFCLMNLASLHAIYKSLVGQVQATWEPEREKGTANSKTRQIALKIVLSGGLVLALAQIFFVFQHNALIQERVFWMLVGLLAYVVFGYMVTLALIALLMRPFKHDRRDDPDFIPKVTLLISAYNEENVIEGKIENCLALDYPTEKLRIVVASDGSTDRTNPIVQSFTARGVVLWPYHPRRGKITAINLAMEKIEDEIVILSDANVVYERSAIRALVKHFKNPAVGAVSGNVSVVNAPSHLGLMDWIYQRYENTIKNLETQIGSITGVDGAMYAIRRSAYRKVQENVILDDLVISMNIARQGNVILFEPEAKGFEHAAITVKEGFCTRVRVIAGAVQAIKQHLAFPLATQPFLLFKFISHKILRWITPLLLIALFAVNLLLIDQGPYKVLLVLQGAIYILGLIGFLTGASTYILSIPFYFCMQNAATLVGIWRGLTDRQSVMWNKAERYVGKKGMKEFHETYH